MTRTTANNEAAALKEQIARDKAKWKAMSPEMRKSFENELAAIWPTFPRTEKPHA